MVDPLSWICPGQDFQWRVDRHPHWSWTDTCLLHPIYDTVDRSSSYTLCDWLLPCIVPGLAMDLFAQNRNLIVILTVLLIAFTSCSPDTSTSAEACELAAVAQAAAEERWGRILEQHVRADQELETDPSSVAAKAAHDDSAAFLVGARVDVILAEAETRNSCG